MSSWNINVSFPQGTQYQISTKPVLVPPPSVGWLRPFSEPVRKRVIAAAMIAASGLMAPPTVTTPTARTVDKWLQPWSTPQVLTKRGLATRHQPAATWINFTPAGEIVTQDKWYAAWREGVAVQLKRAMGLES